MARILVAGGLPEEEQDVQLREARDYFASALGRELIVQRHVLLGACQTQLDAVVATAAAEEALRQGVDVSRVVRSWVSPGMTPVHRVGEITKSSVGDWSHVPRGFAFPEPIRQADAVILVGGWDGTHYAASWARLANKPLLPVATFGLAAEEIFEHEVQSFERRYANRLTRDEFDLLNRVPELQSDAVKAFAGEVVALAERLITPTGVFVVMSFAEQGDLEDAYNTFRSVCEMKRFVAFRVDDHLVAGGHIVPSIMDAIRHSAFIIADVSEPRPNVYYELGFAQALGKDVITTARKGTQLPFDIFDLPTLYWDSQHVLRQKLLEAITPIAEKFGR